MFKVESRQAENAPMQEGATTFSIITISIIIFSITTLSIMTLSIKGLFVTLNINDIQHNILYAIMLSVAIYVLLC